MKIVCNTYSFDNQPRRVRMFGDQQAFRQHLKHFTDSHQPWNTIASLRDIRTLCQKRSASAVTHLYKRIVTVLDRGIKFACTYPLYVSYTESTVQRPGRRKKHVLLTHYGFLVACNESVVLSAYFKASANRSSPRQCFEAAWLEIRQRCLAAAYSRPDGTRVYLHDVVHHNHHTWSHMPRWCDIAPPDIVPEPSPRAATFFARPDLWSPLQAHVKSLTP